MTTARSTQVNLDATPYYHCVARCVRRAFLCGNDFYTGKNYDHRKRWVLDRLRVAGEAFTISLCAYAVLSNHVHVVLRVMRDTAMSMREDELLRRVRLIFPRTADGFEDRAESDKARFVEIWRERLCSVSWFMRCLNEPIARRANAEDGCTGRFWEGRFRSQALLDEGALLAAMSYVDLNPIRAGTADSLEDSSWTSIRQRLLEAAGDEVCAEAPAIASLQDAPGGNTAPAGESDRPTSLPTVGALPADKPDLPIGIADYVELLTETGQCLQHGKRGKLSVTNTRLLRRLGLRPETWSSTVGSVGNLAVLVGPPAVMHRLAPDFGRRFARGIRACGVLFAADMAA